jgi:hypothetical protein
VLRLWEKISWWREWERRGDLVVREPQPASRGPSVVPPLLGHRTTTISTITGAPQTCLVESLYPPREYPQHLPVPQLQPLSLRVDRCEDGTSRLELLQRPVCDCNSNREVQSGNKLSYSFSAWPKPVRSMVVCSEVYCGPGAKMRCGHALHYLIRP